MAISSSIRLDGQRPPSPRGSVARPLYRRLGRDGWLPTPSTMPNTLASSTRLARARRLNRKCGVLFSTCRWWILPLVPVSPPVLSWWRKVEGGCWSARGGPGSRNTPAFNKLIVFMPSFVIVTDFPTVFFSGVLGFAQKVTSFLICFGSQLIYA